jgi:hypothetical protein
VSWRPVTGAPLSDRKQVCREFLPVLISPYALESFSQRFDYGSSLALARQLGQCVYEAVGLRAFDVQGH